VKSTLLVKRFLPASLTEKAAQSASADERPFLRFDAQAN